jgi:hypothetical protein
VKIDELRRAKNQRPFVPFRIVTADSREPIEISHPDAVSWDDRDNPRVALALSGGEHHWIAVALITRLVAPLPAPPADSNGGEG